MFNSLSVGSDTNLSHPYFPRVIGGPGGGFRDVVDIVIVKRFKNINAQRKQKKDLFQLNKIVIFGITKVEIDHRRIKQKKIIVQQIFKW